MPEKIVALVTGANKGLGFKTSRQLAKLLMHSPYILHMRSKTPQ